MNFVRAGQILVSVSYHKVYYVGPDVRHNQPVVTPSVRHGFGIPGGLTDMGITGTDTDCLFCTHAHTRTHIH
jgi:hypothetical protein